MDKATWTCQCGKVEVEVPTTGVRLKCYCKSCRAFVERLGKTERLDAAGGSDLLQVAPDGVRILKGQEHLAWLRLTEKGPLRWYATCCNTPMANILPTRHVPFASFQVADLSPQDGLPKVAAKVHLKGALAHVDGPHGSALPMILALLGRMVSAHVTGKWRRNPFFDDNGDLIAERRDPVPNDG
ncbi:MAG: DUF6151 family protein [Paracoccaceae bacterium]|nr:DUF6151 family protein [Paracoccaceae bacterium]